MKFLHLLLLSTFAFVIVFAITSTPETTSDGQKSSKKDDVRQKFKKWKTDNNKTYSNPNDEKKAENNYAANENAIEEHNKRKNETFKRGSSDHSDMSYEDKKVKRMGVKKRSNKKSKRNSTLRKKREDTPLPATVDYRPMMSPIKNQADCGACWAFACNAVLEYQINVKRNVSIQLSEQELIDCNLNSMDCDTGGWPAYAYDYIIKSGLASNEVYEFLAYTNDCLNDRVNRTTRITDSCELDMGGDDGSLQWIIANYGPVVATLWATDPFTSYKSGVYNESGCPTIQANHAVAVVGYGTDPVFGDFWWIKNSWGKSWGYDGYGKFARGSNTCGIANNAMFPCNTDV